ncbi:hypothetical protein L6164_013337 [Bauhinia variegata]|uniref:Uncharacterized protein n=1 Tax=Bauhinia variegata TaxID=167791 RepID=A0ACB9PD33_BAUVA|nr:hypothetical protein L6164_013337 [Bauhinia variegata]
MEKASFNLALVVIVLALAACDGRSFPSALTKQCTRDINCFNQNILCSEGTLVCNSITYRCECVDEKLIDHFIPSSQCRSNEDCDYYCRGCPNRKCHDGVCQCNC